jgi:hypothetical protein
MTYVGSESDDRTVNNAMRHQYRVLSDAEKAAMVRIKDLGEQFIIAMAETEVEEAVMWAVKGLTA